jgi:hypothetical protein
MKRFLGLTQEELTENERMWKEENGGNLASASDAGAEMRSAGITPGAIAADAADQTADAPMEAPPADAGAGGGEAAVPPA